MILDYDYSHEKKQLSISYIEQDGNKKILHFDNISKFPTYYYTPTGRFDTWDGAKCDVKFTQKPSKFDIKEFIYRLAPEYQQKIMLRTFPKLYACDIEVKVVSRDVFTDPTVADQPITTMSVVSPNMNSIVLGTRELSDDEIKSIQKRFDDYLDSIPFYKTLNLPAKPGFKYIYFETEEAMLRWFLEKVVAQAPILAGWNFIGYDWTYITHRIKNFYPNLSIAQASPTHTTRRQNFTNKKGEKILLTHPVHTLVMDMMEIIENEDKVVMPIKESMNLDYIAHESLGANKIHYTGSLQDLYNTDYPTYVFYNAVDSILVQLINIKFKTMDHIYMYALFCKERIGKCFSKISLTEALIYQNFDKRGIKIVYEDKDQPERGNLIGAYVKKPKPGRWEYIVCNDFASLYPSTIRTCNLSFENFIGAYYDEATLNKYRSDPKYIVIGPSVYENEGSIDKPSTGQLIGTFLDEEKLNEYRGDPNYFVSVNGSVYKNDKDYTLKQIQSDLYATRNTSKYLSKKMDATVASDLEHLIANHDEKLHDYADDVIACLKELGYDAKCGEDLKKIKDLKTMQRIVNEEITYHSNLEQAVKLMMNSIYGGASHVAFYWFNMKLANDITGESRNLIHLMERHLNEYWKTAWTTEPQLKAIQDKLNLKLKPKPEIEKILKNSREESLVTLVYGDTDSLYVSYEPLLATIVNNEKMDAYEKLNILLEINLNFLDEHNRQYIEEYYKDRFGVSVHKFELETVARSGVWLNVKKRYGQLLMYKDGKTFDADNMKVKVKGLEVIKSSYPTIARKQLKDMLQFLLQYQGKYLAQELNLKMMQHKQEFFKADIEDICGNIGAHNYYDYVISDTGDEPVCRKGTPSHVRALALYNWLNNTRHLGSEPLYGGKIKIYVVSGSKKDKDICFGFESTKYPEWATKYAPVDRKRMFQKYVLDPFNRILEAMQMPVINIDGSIQMSIF